MKRNINECISLYISVCVCVFFLFFLSKLIFYLIINQLSRVIKLLQLVMGKNRRSMMMLMLKLRQRLIWFV